MASTRSVRRALASAAVLALVALFAGAAHAYVLRPRAVGTVGRSQKGGHFWQPSRAIALSPFGIALRVLTAPEDCAETNTCTYVAAYSADEGDSWHVEEKFTEFCGTGGVLENDVLRCTSEQVIDDGNDTVVTYTQKDYSIQKGGLIRGQKFIEKKHSRHATFENPPGVEVASLRLGDTVVPFPDKGLFLRDGEVVATNGTRLHVMYKSNDGHDWNFVSVVPFPFGVESSLQRIGDTKVLLQAGRPGNYTQAQSIYLGTRWEKIQTVEQPSLLSTYMSPFFTSIFTGVRGRPGVFAFAAGGKKGSEKPVNIADFHNRLVEKSKAERTDGASNFSAAFLNATEFRCLDKPHSKEGEDGCESSSTTAIASPKNGTVLVFYDKLHSGFAPAHGDNHDEGSTVHVMKLDLNETKEEKEHEEKLAEDVKRRVREAVAEEERIKARKEQEERRKKERREKHRKDKERRALFFERDAPALAQATADAEKDGEFVVVRDVDTDLLDIEKEVY